MKQETKKIVKWIKEHIHTLNESGIVAMTTITDSINMYDKAMDFLDSLPQIESHLCKGGYIQDKNGTPCCDGDEVVFTYYADCINVPKKKGQLRWSPYHRFIIIVNNEEYDFMDNEIIEFEKITEEK